MDTMNDLLICAGLVGIEIELEPLQDNNQLVYVDENGYLHDYNPLTKDAQAMELLKWIFNEMVRRDDGSFRKEWMLIIWQNFIRAKSLNEAIIKAVVAMEDTHE